MGSQRKEKMRSRRAEALSGSGKFRFRNTSGADLMLAKPLEDGTRMIAPNGEFIGDSYYRKFVPEFLQISEVIEHVNPNLPPPDVELAEVEQGCESLRVGEELRIKVVDVPTPNEIPTTESALVVTEELVEETSEEGVSDLSTDTGGKRQRRPVEETDKMINELFESGISVIKIAERLGYSLSYIRYRRKVMSKVSRGQELPAE